MHFGWSSSWIKWKLLHRLGQGLLICWIYLKYPSGKGPTENVCHSWKVTGCTSHQSHSFKADQLGFYFELKQPLEAPYWWKGRHKMSVGTRCLLQCVKLVQKPVWESCKRILSQKEAFYAVLCSSDKTAATVASTLVSLAAARLVVTSCISLKAAQAVSPCFRHGLKDPIPGQSENTLSQDAPAGHQTPGSLPNRSSSPPSQCGCEGLSASCRHSAGLILTSCTVRQHVSWLE